MTKVPCETLDGVKPVQLTFFSTIMHEVQPTNAGDAIVHAIQTCSFAFARFFLFVFVLVYHEISSDHSRGK